MISAPFYVPEKLEEDTAIRRKVKWLNDGKPIERRFGGAGLISRLKYQGTCVGATDLLENIETALRESQQDGQPSFKDQLNEKLIKETADMLISNQAFLDNGKFEQLIQQLMQAMGAKTSNIPPKQRYAGSIADVDVIADFEQLALRFYIQAKHHRLISSEHAIRQLTEAMKIDSPESESPIIGWAITSGKFSEQAEELANKEGIRCIDGEGLAEMLVAVGLEKFEL